MKRILLAITLFLTLIGAANAQSTTTVTSTVKDPSGTAYAFGTYGITFTNPTTQQAFYGGVPLQPSQMLYTGQLDINGALSISLPSNAVITPSGTQWTFKICANTSQIAMVYPPPTLPCFSSAQTISGSSQVITFTAATIPVAGGSSITPNSPLPAATSGPGPVFNVKNYGAKGDTQSSTNCTAALFNLNCTDVTFTAANVGQRVSCASNFSTIQPATAKFSAFVNATNMTMDTSSSGPGICIWGTPDDTAVTTALTAALAQMCSAVSSGNLCTSTASPTLYFPAGAYSFFNTSINVIVGGPSKSGFAIKGDGADQTKLYWHTGSTNAQGAALTCSNAGNIVIEGFTMDGAQGNHSFSNAAWYPVCGTLARNVIIQRFNGKGLYATNTFYGNKIVSVGNNGTGMTFNGGTDMYESLTSNNFGNNLLVQNVAGIPFGSGFRWVGGLFDEGGIANASIQIQNSSDVWFISAPIFTGIQVDGQSFVHFNGSITGPFSTDNNVNGVTIAAGGVVQASDTRFAGSGTGKCISNSGSFLDNGGNTCESVFNISSGTSTGTTAVLTLVPNSSNVNTNCSVGDALMVQSAGIAGYNGYYPAGATSGITAVTATTLTYTTAGSNLGALGASGTAFCRNLQTYTGNLPRALLNNPIPNTCYVTGTFGATTTAAPMCTFKVQNAANITYIKASSTTVTACTVAPVVTITDGTGTQTLTITTAKSIWDSSVDASSGVNTTIFKPNGTITVSNTAGTCTTPPTNFAVSYNISPILSN